MIATGKIVSDAKKRIVSVAGLVWFACFVFSLISCACGSFVSQSTTTTTITHYRYCNSCMIGKKVRVFWPVDENWYEGIVHEYDPSSGEHLLRYEDGDSEWVRIGSGASGTEGQHQPPNAISPGDSTVASKGSSQQQPPKGDEPPPHPQQPPQHGGGYPPLDEGPMMRPGVPPQQQQPPPPQAGVYYGPPPSYHHPQGTPIMYYHPTAHSIATPYPHAGAAGASPHEHAILSQGGGPPHELSSPPPIDPRESMVSPTGGAGRSGKKGPKAWSKHEDATLLKIVQSMSMPMRWSVVAQSLPDRTGKQCRERYEPELVCVCVCLRVQGAEGKGLVCRCCSYFWCCCILNSCFVFSRSICAF